MNNIVKKDNVQIIAETLESSGMMAQVAKAIPSHMNAKQIVRVATTALRTNPNFRECKLASFLGAFMQAAQLGLEPNTVLGHAYLIPYKTECTFQIGYKGLINLAYRSGECKIVYAQEVYPNDEFEYTLGLDPDMKHKPAQKPEGLPIYYYAVYKGMNGVSHFKVWPREKIEQHKRKFSRAFDKGPWSTNYDEMAKKTVLKDLLKTLPLSTELIRAANTDGAKMDYNIKDSEPVIDIETAFDFPEMQEERKIVLPETAVSSSDVEPKKNLKDFMVKKDEIQV